MSESTSDNRQVCPQCGHLNRATAKVCAQCERPLKLTRVTGTLRKFCPQCGHENRLRAKVCVSCGHVFRSGKLQKPTVTTADGPKWCPQCGAPRRPGAKVCNRCGFHFRTAQPQPTQAPVMQNPPPAIELPPDIPAPVELPPTLHGEPAPYMSDDELDRLREGGVYHPNVFIRFLHQVKK